MGIKMNIAKTKVMSADITSINVDNVLMENVPGYVYLGQHYNLKEKNQDKEIIWRRARHYVQSQNNGMYVFSS